LGKFLKLEHFTAYVFDKHIFAFRGNFFKNFQKKTFVGLQPQKINLAKFHTKRKDALTIYSTNDPRKKKLC
jgi:hypothetical protein